VPYIFRIRRIDRPTGRFQFQCAPGALDPTNPVDESFYRAEAEVDRDGHFQFTETNAYSGNNGCAVVFNNSQGDNFFDTAGNAGNGGNPQPNGIVLGAGTQIINLANEAPCL
jgi:hypothetical protein